MSKERLEEAKLMAEMLRVETRLPHDFPFDLVDWLVEQAEQKQSLETAVDFYQSALRDADRRVQELEDKLAEIRFVNNDYDKQNKRYREAREIIEQEYKEHNVGVVYGYEDGYLDGLDTAMDIIDKALEGEE